MFSNKNKFIEILQKDYLIITKNKISKKYIKKNIIPIFDFINSNNNKKILISGAQGIGKTTIMKILQKNFYKFYGKKILCLSLDDFYYNKRQRIHLSKTIHPLMKTRGVPGTHNINKILEIIKKFNKSEYPIKIPLFNKLMDTTAGNKIINGKNNKLILEGWCCGSPPITKNYLNKNINKLEKKFDKKFLWRNYYNDKLKNEYSKLFDKFDSLIYFKTSSFNNILRWRIKQEKNMKNNSKKYLTSMNNNEINEFIQHYQKITKWMMKSLPYKANLLIDIDKNQKIKKISSG